MLKSLTNWLDDRTGYKAIAHHALEEPIPGGARWKYVFGSALTSTFMIQLFTGILLMFSYSPSAQTAWGSVYYINNVMTWGWIIRGIHHFGSQAMVILLVLHMIQVLIAGAYRAPREINWWFGMGLMFVTLGFSLTGYLLPWDQKGYWATKVATNIAGGAPVLGEYIQKAIVGGTDYGNQTITRFYGLHVGVLPASLAILLVGHIYMFRKHGVTHSPRHTGTESFWPKQVFMDVAASLLVVGVLFALVFYYGGADLDAPADPSRSDYPARPEWYFLSLFQMLKLFPGSREMIGTIVVPSAILVVLMAMPLFDKILPRGFAHFLACSVVFALVGGAGYLTLTAMKEDASNWEFLAQREGADEAAHRANELARDGITPAGPAYLLSADPAYNGRRVLEAKCLSCHYYGGKGLVTREVSPLSAADLAGASPMVVDLPDVPEPVKRALAVKAKDFKPTAAARGTLFGNNPIVRLTGTGKDGLNVMAEVAPDGKAILVSTESPQVAADLEGYGTAPWLKGLLAAPGSDKYFGKVPQCRGMNGWRKKWDERLAKLDKPAAEAEERKLGDVAELVVDLLSKQKGDAGIEELEAVPEVKAHRGFETFKQQCATCHVGEGLEAPRVVGWGSDDWTRRMIEKPGDEGLYGWLPPEKQMPAFGGKLSANDLETLLRHLRGEAKGIATLGGNRGLRRADPDAPVVFGD